MFEWSETDKAIREAIQQFVEREIAPHRDELEHGDMPPYGIIRKLLEAFGIGEMAIDQFDRSIAKAEKKLASADSDAEDAPKPKRGGDKSSSPMAGVDSMAFIAMSELCKTSMGLTAAMGVSLGMAAATIESRGTIEQRKRWSRDLLTFDKVGAWAITEPDAGSDAFGGMRTTVKPDGDGFRLSGQKTFITNGPYADTVVVYAKFDDGSGVPRRQQPVMTFVLDSGMEGFEQSKPFRKMGMHSSPTGQLFFDNVRLERDRLLEGGGTSGKDSARANFTFERVGVAAMSLGIIEECMRLCLDYARTRELWGKPIGDLQLIQLKLAEMEVARLNVEGMLFRSIEASRAGKSLGLAQASAIKLYSSRAATEVAMEAVQLFGGNGYMAEYRVEQLARDAKSLMIYAGSNEVQVTHVAKGLLAG